MNKYKIGKYIVKADSICTAVSIVRQIKDTSDDFDKDYARESQAVEKDVKKANEDYNRLGNKSASELFEMMGYKRDGYKYYKSNGSYTRVIVFNDFDDIKYYVLKDGVIPRGWTLTKTKWYDSVKDGKYVSELKPGNVITKKDGSKWDVVLVRHTPFGIQVRMNSKTSPVKTEEITYRPTDMLAYDSVKDARTISPWALSRGKRILSEDGDKATVVSVKGDRRNGYDVVVKFDDGSTDKWYYMPDDVITVIDSGKKIGTMTDTVEKTGDSIETGHEDERQTEMAIRFAVKEGKNQHGYYEYQGNADVAQVRRVLKRLGYHDEGYNKNPAGMMNRLTFYFADSIKDSLTVRDVIQSLINEETSAISSYNVALETLKDHIPDEAYEAIKAIRDDEQRHVENLYAVLNGNVTPKNLEN